MPNLPFTLRQLEVFSSLCETRSFRRSAEKLGISQASVSSQMKLLEQQLGVTLLARRPGARPSLTGEGVAFLDDLRAFRGAAEALAAHRRGGGEEDRSVRYRVLVGQVMLDNYIRPKLDRFFAQHAQIELIFDARPPSGSLARDVEDGHFDFALIHRRVGRSVEPYLRELAIVRGGIYGHRKFTEGRTLPLDVDVLNELPFIMPLAASTDEREMLALLGRWGIHPHRVVGHTQYYDVMAAMLERGVGIASFSDAILRPEMRDKVVMLHPLENWRLLWFRKNPDDPRCDAVQSFLWSSVLQDPDFLTVSTSVDVEAAFAGAVES